MWLGDAWGEISPPAASPEQRPADVILVMQHTCRVSGRVIDADSQPVNGAVVHFGSGWSRTRPLNVRKPAPAVTDEQGRFEVLVRGSSWLPFIAQHGTEWSTEGSVISMNHEVDPTLLRLGTPFHVGGQVLRPDGSPAAGATVHAESDDGKCEWTLADTDGRFQLALPESGHWTVGSVSAPLVPVDVAEVEVGSSSTAPGITLRLMESSKIRGRVIWATGEPAAGVEVSAMKSFMDDNRITRMIQLLPYPLTATSAADGSFELAPTHPAATYDVSAEDAASGATAVAARQIVGDGTTLLKIDAATALIGSLVVDITDADTGRPITGRTDRGRRAA
jgi:hypothetical protein